MHMYCSVSLIKSVQTLKIEYEIKIWIKAYMKENKIQTESKMHMKQGACTLSDLTGGK